MKMATRLLLMAWLSFWGGNGRPLPNGDQVRVTGQVTEFFGFTELDDNGLQIQREADNVPLPDPIFIDPPAANEALAAYFEPLESMRVAVAGEARVVGPTFGGCGFSVVTESMTAARIFRRQLADPIGEVLPILHTSDVDCTGFPVVQVGRYGKRTGWPANLQF